jgi:hypothetical protein
MRFVDAAVEKSESRQIQAVWSAFKREPSRELPDDVARAVLRVLQQAEGHLRGRLDSSSLGEDEAADVSNDLGFVRAIESDLMRYLELTQREKMNISFEGIWADIRRRLRLGSTIKNWSADRGYTGGTFRINDVDGAAVIVTSDRIAKERRISKGDFERIFGLWSAYKVGTIRRGELITKSQNTTYIISLLHWQETSEADHPS